MNKEWVHKIAVGAIRETIRNHGPITPQLTGSAAKRVAGRIWGELQALEKQHATTNEEVQGSMPLGSLAGRG